MEGKGWAKNLERLFYLTVGHLWSAAYPTIPRAITLMDSPIPSRTFALRLLLGMLVVPVLALTLSLIGCEALVRDTTSLLIPRFHRSEIFGFVAGLGTTFAVLPDLISMLRRQSSAGMNPRMAAIVGTFQILWVYYGLLITSRPVVAWNVIGVLINFFTVGAYSHFMRKEKARVANQSNI